MAQLEECPPIFTKYRAPTPAPHSTGYGGACLESGNAVREITNLINPLLHREFKENLCYFVLKGKTTEKQ